MTVAVTVKSPSASSAGTSTEKVPSFSTIAIKVCVFSALSVTVIDTLLPGAWSVLPEMVGVASLVLP